MIKTADELKCRGIEIDLTGPGGNAYALMAKARKIAVALGEEPDSILAEMQEGDYEHFAGGV